MSLRRTLKENVFGPFDANDVLDEYVTHKKNAPVDLHRLEVVRNEQRSGLDDSERTISKKRVGKIKYLGILYIDDLNWISPAGRGLIHDDMRDRGLKLTLESIYGPDRPNDGLTVKIGVNIQYMNLTYLTEISRRYDIVFLHNQHEHTAIQGRFVEPNVPLQKPENPKPTPEDFFNAYMDHQAKRGKRVSKESTVELMLTHAMWLVEEAKRYVDVQSWEEFARSKILNVDEQRDVEIDEPEHERPLCPIPSSPIPLSPKRKRSRSVNSRSSLEYASEDQLFGNESERGSSPERSPSPPLTNPYVAVRVPMTFRFTPRVPDDFHWWCEIEGCYYNIDMLNLTNENLAVLDGGTAGKLRLQDWSLSDPWVRLAFKTMVEGHRVKHLESWGLRCIEGLSGALAHIELAEPPELDRRKDKLSDLKIEFVNLLL